MAGLTAGHSMSLTESVTGRNAPHLFYKGKEAVE
jgi:hypothetical protein